MKLSLVPVAALALLGAAPSLLLASPDKPGRGPVSKPVTAKRPAPAAKPENATLTIEPGAQALLDQVAAATRKTQALTGTLTVEQNAAGRQQTMSARFRALRPNYVFLQATSPVAHTLASDGATVYTVTNGQYTRRSVEAGGARLGAPPPLDLFFEPGGLSALLGGKGGAGEVRLAPEETVGTTPCRVLHARLTRPMAQDLRIYVGPEGLVRRLSRTMAKGGEGVSLQVTLEELAVDPPLRPADFAFQPPEGARLYDSSKSMEENLVPVGREAPEFTLPAPGGGTVSLAEARQGRKAVLINFWAYG